MAGMRDYSRGRRGGQSERRSRRDSDLLGLVSCQAGPAVESASAAVVQWPVMDDETSFVNENAAATSWFEKRGVLTKIRQLLSERSGEGYLVGGYVRDLLLVRFTRDLDLVVAGDAVPLARELADRLGGAFVLLDQERHTARVVLRDGGERFYVDLATMHSDGLLADLERRDFTVNAMAVDIRDTTPRPEIFDPLGGRLDLDDRRLRAVSDRAFQEDAIRLLRAVRLSAELSLQVEGHTEQLMLRDASLIGQVSAERVRDELCQILAASQAEDSLRYLDRLGLLSALLPELDPLRGLEQPPPHYQDVFQHSLTVVGALNEVGGALQQMARDESDLVVLRGGESERMKGYFVEALAPYAQRLVAHLDERLAEERGRAALLKLCGLLHDVGKANTLTVDEEGRRRFFGHAREGAAIAAAVARRLRFGNREVRLVQTVVRHHMRPLQLAQVESISRRAIYRFFRDTQGRGVDVLLLALADNLALVYQGTNVEQWRRMCETARLLLGAYCERYQEVVEPVPLISGGELLERLGMEPGPDVGRILRALHEAQATGEVTSTEEALELAQSLLGE